MFHRACHLESQTEVFFTSNSQIYHTSAAFVALDAVNGLARCWGHASFGGGMSEWKLGGWWAAPDMAPTVAIADVKSNENTQSCRASDGRVC